MKAKISALMDGEMQDQEFTESMRALREGGEALETWREYHVISDALRDTQLLSSGFSIRVMARLEQEPTALAPARLPKRAERSRLIELSLAAGLAILLVGWLAFAPNSGLDPGSSQVAKGPAQVAADSTAVPPPSAANDYLLAHQNYSPRGSLQGVAAYVRTVSAKASAR